MEITINKALVLGKVIRERMNDLKGLRSSVATKKTWMGTSERGETIEPTYDIKELDKAIIKLQQMAFELESAIKEKNNTAVVIFNHDVSDLFANIV